MKRNKGDWSFSFLVAAEKLTSDFIQNVVFFGGLTFHVDVCLEYADLKNIARTHARTKSENLSSSI